MICDSKFPIYHSENAFVVYDNGILYNLGDAMILINRA